MLRIHFRNAAQNITTQISVLKRVFSEKICVHFKRLARILFGKSAKVW